MSAGTPASNRRRRSRSSRRKTSARPFWGDPEVAAGPEHDIEPVEHATALIDSLGAPPFPRADAAPHYFAAVYARATGMALALAQAYGIVADEDDDDADGGDDDTAALDPRGSVTSDT
jgi:hypothetical protein